MDKNIITKRLEDFEGKSATMYFDSEGLATIGVGRCIETNPLKEHEIEYLLESDIAVTIEKLDKQWPDWRDFPEAVQYVCVDLVFNMGINNWLSFRKTRALMELGEWQKASLELLNSKYATQVGRRALFNSEELARCQSHLTIIKTTEE